MIVDVQNLRVSLPIDGRLRAVVRDVSFHVAAGEILGVVGESGCGKSMTNLALLGLLPPGAEVKAERFMLAGHDLLTADARDWRAVRGRVAAAIFQNPMSALNPVLTIGAQLFETARWAEARYGRQERRDRALQLLERVGIDSPAICLALYPHQLSGGMAQRVMIALALACEPALLVADEPTTALDADIRTQILDLLARLCVEDDMAVVLVSHDFCVVQRYAHRIHVMYSGEIVEAGPVAAVSASPAHPYTARLVAALPGGPRYAPKSPLPAIPGVVPPIYREFQGCRFAERCSQALELCHLQPAPLRVSQSRLARCHIQGIAG